MFGQVNQLIPGFELRVEEPTKILIEDCNSASGDFVLYSLMELYLRSQAKVLFIGAANSFHHYSAVLKKLVSPITNTNFLLGPQLATSHRQKPSRVHGPLLCSF